MERETKSQRTPCSQHDLIGCKSAKNRAKLTCLCPNETFESQLKSFITYFDPVCVASKRNLQRKYHPLSYIHEYASHNVSLVRKCDIFSDGWNEGGLKYAAKGARRAFTTSVKGDGYYICKNEQRLTNLSFDISTGSQQPKDLSFLFTSDLLQ